MSIDRRHLLTGSLLAFVAVTAVTLGVKEIRHARAVAAAEMALPVPPVPKAGAPPAALRPAVQPATIYVTYFRSTARCMSCLKIEDLTDAAMTTRFAGPIADKRVVWRTLNVDEPENNHFMKDYGLYTKSVVVSEVRNEREVRWKNLDQVWQLLGDPAAFQSYVEREVQAFLEKA
ncbi:MAG TPA: nitrophenyl compound nitroreductase subunit ArsF family protein [Thermoanaerobaculia bacterium]|nr:nitrophenyl compound nitroreductase subunit ArsF family protein [Thermoanaerobaculia bacterium]